MATESPVDARPGKGATIALWTVATVTAVFWILMTTGIAGLLIRRGGWAAAWAICILFAVVLLILAGREVNGRWLGILIDARNKYSLARLQITIWTVIVMTAFLTIAFPRIRALAQGTLAQADTLNIKFPAELILAMGISAASFAGASLIKKTKSDKTATIKIDQKPTTDVTRMRRDKAKEDLADAERAILRAVAVEDTRKSARDAAKQAVVAAAAADKPAAEEQVKEAEMLLTSATRDREKVTKDRDAKKAALEAAEKDFVAATEAEGLLHRNASPSEASWVDLVRGEEIGNYKLVDMSKVQMLFFTIAVVAAYSGSIIALLYNGQGPLKPGEISFPEFSETLAALLGISHGTYLSVKAVDHT